MNVTFCVKRAEPDVVSVVGSQWRAFSNRFAGAVGRQFDRLGLARPMR
jgi:hypothetical protein